MGDVAQGNDEFFQVTSDSKNLSSAKVKRVYIGGLPKNVPTLEKDLTDWMQSQVPELTISSITINEGGKNPHALVDCGKFANQAISKLHQQSFQGRKLTVQREKRKNNKKSSTGNDGKKQFGGWSKPKKPQFKPISMEEAGKNIQSVVSEEMKQAENAGEDTLNVAIASTAAATFLAAMNGIADPVGDLGDPEGPVNDEDPDQSTEDKGFQLKAMSDLLADFGQADPNWQKQRVEETAEDAGSSDSRLARKGKAPIHIVLGSFGFQNGAPKRPEGWSYSQPLAIMDCREQFESVPKYLEWKTGLSGAVKRVLQQENKDIQKHARTTVADQVWGCLLEAQNAGHGYASPLEMTIYIGSETGKHRSVVICEWAATAVRKKLRANDKGVIQHEVSVETRHRDIDRFRNNSNKQQQQKKKHDFAGDW
ncbi:unnamed protein product [Cylindrotheca closterium]|uniref:RapZ C-terminal domain-containing protein n=1 Tax=Cylindrotheca closterium TaxID=2856 RepID=A0AAD2JJ63_9STRA|nr:unnamed protein product [Cylindrotheca closterium]